MGARRTEDRHDIVARELHHPTLVADDLGGQCVEDPVDDDGRLLGIVQALGEGGRAAHVGEQRRDLAEIAARHHPLLPKEIEEAGRRPGQRPERLRRHEATIAGILAEGGQHEAEFGRPDRDPVAIAQLAQGHDRLVVDTDAIGGAEIGEQVGTVAVPDAGVIAQYPSIVRQGDVAPRRAPDPRLQIEQPPIAARQFEPADDRARQMQRREAGRGEPGGE